MDEKRLLDTALEMGFANAALMDTAELVFIPAFRPLCEENLCGKYGVNYACPPDCGTVEEMRVQPVQPLRHHSGGALPVPGQTLLLHVGLLHLCGGDGQTVRDGVRLRPPGHRVFQHVLL